ncbi:MAG: MFS transporter [Bacteriovoracaceae bacterium]
MKDRGFWSLFGAMFLGAFNDNVFKTALVILITFKGISVFGLSPEIVVSLSAGIFILPFFLFSALAGEMAEHYSKSSMICLTKVTEFIFMTIAGIGFYFESFELLLVVLFFMGAQSAFFGPLKYSTIPEIVSDDKIVSSNALVSGGTFISILLGTILGGMLGGGQHTASEAGDSFWLRAIIPSVIALVGFIISLGLPKLEAKVSDKIQSTNPLKLISLNLQYFKRNEKARYLIHGISWYWCIGAVILTILPIVSKEWFQGDENLATFFLALFTVGMGIGSIFFGKFSKRDDLVGLSQLSLLIMAILLLLLSFNLEQYNSFTKVGISDFFEFPGSWCHAVLFFGVAFFGGGYIVPLYSKMQIDFKDEGLSKLIANNNILNALYMVVASVFMSLIFAQGGDVKLILLIAGLLSILVFFKQYFKRPYEFWKHLLGAVIRIGYKVKVVGKDDFPEKEPYIVVANHISFIDWILLSHLCPHRIYYVIDHSFYFHPFLKWFFGHMELIPIAPKKENEEILNQAFLDIDRTLKENKVLGLFPEGWISRDGELRKFQPGILKILKDNPVPICVAGIKGLWGSWTSYGHPKGLGVLPPFKGLPNPFKRRTITLKLISVLNSDEYDQDQARDQIESFVNGDQNE